MSNLRRRRRSSVTVAAPVAYTLTLQPDAAAGMDNAMVSSAPENIYGTLALIDVGDTDGVGSSADRSLIQFDVSSIPAGATITSVTLSLWEYNAARGGGAASDAAVSLYRIKRAWVESQSNWNKADNEHTILWATAGCSNTTSDRAAAASASTTLDGTAANAFVTWSGAGMVADVQAWVAGTASNYGWLIASAGEYAGAAQTSYNQFRSSDYTVDATQRPKLVVEYTSLPFDVTNLSFTTAAATITPSLTVNNGSPTPQWMVVESSGVSYPYTGNGFTHNRVAAGDYTVTLINTAAVAAYVDIVDFQDDCGIKSSWAALHLELFSNIRSILTRSNPAMTGDITGYVWPAQLAGFYISGDAGLTGNLHGWQITPHMDKLSIVSIPLTGDVSHWIFPAGMTYLAAYDTSLTGDISQWALPSSMQQFLVHSMPFTGDLSGWTFPSGMTNFQISGVNVHGSISGWTLPAGLTNFQASSTGLSGCPSFANCVGLVDFQLAGCGLSQASVDAILAAVYARRMSFSGAAPQLLLAGGSNPNAAPSGTYQNNATPTTGNEYRYKLVNDPDSEGFHKWTVSVT